jgi:transcriptional regulator with XRE-family HTH domain
MKKPQANARAEFFAAIEKGELPLRDAVRAMRKSIGLTQAEYAKLIGIAPRIVIDLERGVGNPTLASLLKIGKPFGLELAFVRKKAGG